MNIFAISGLLIGVTMAAEGLLMFIRGKDKSQYLWGMFCFAVMLWGFGGYKIATTIEYESSIFWWRFAYVGVILIPVFLTHFVYSFLKISKQWLLYIIYPLGVFFLIINFIDGLFIDKVRLVFNQFYYISPPAPFYTPFVILFLVLVTYSLIRLGQSYKAGHGIEKVQLKYIFFSLLIGFAGGSFSFLPVYKIDFYPFLNFTVSLGTILVGYAIFKHHLMNIKVIATEFLVFVISAFSFIQIFLSQTTNEVIVKSGFFVGVVGIGILLVRSVIQEVRRREQLQELTEKLETANVKLKALDEAKSEFISIASHQLRTPLSFIKGTVSMALEGIWGKLSQGQTRELNKIYVSNERLIKLIDNLLDISRIESGRMEFSFESVALDQMAEETVQQFMSKAKLKKLFLVYKKPAKALSKIKADALKIRQVVMNLIDNALKYTEEGGVTVEVTEGDNKVLFCVTDTGIGISKEQQKLLFQKFSRAKEVTKIHTEGMGLGLYLAAQLVQAHHGRIWVESAGEDKGSKFCFELPMTQ